MKDSRGQVALEFLLTYGWAILIITVIALLLWQMGVFNPAGQVRPGSSGFWGIIPYEDFSYTDNGVLRIPISNKVGGNVTIIQINATVEGVTCPDTSPESHITGGAIFAAGETKVWTSPATAGFPQIAAGGHYNIFVSIEYTDSRSGEEYLSSGWIWGNVEEA
ncbi:MAG: hypothetical protein JW778_06460 [Candidatus Altiarchaeota archaeon]|nr:hypothetical protein [Candidatus Altiarchaeota archaeon]